MMNKTWSLCINSEKHFSPNQTEEVKNELGLPRVLQLLFLKSPHGCLSWSRAPFTHTVWGQSNAIRAPGDSQAYSHCRVEALGESHRFHGNSPKRASPARGSPPLGSYRRGCLRVLEEHTNTLSCDREWRWTRTEITLWKHTQSTPFMLQKFYFSADLLLSMRPNPYNLMPSTRTSVRLSSWVYPDPDRSTDNGNGPTLKMVRIFPLQGEVVTSSYCVPGDGESVSHTRPSLHSHQLWALALPPPRA